MIVSKVSCAVPFLRGERIIEILYQNNIAVQSQAGPLGRTTMGECLVSKLLRRFLIHPPSLREGLSLLK